MPRDWFAKERLEGERLTTGAAPVPVRLTIWGLPVALSVIVSEAARLPVAEGVKVTLKVQWLPVASEVAQVLVGTKSLALVPVTATLVRLRAASPVLFKVTLCASLTTPTV